jgi:hypothetical protein
MLHRLIWMLSGRHLLSKKGRVVSAHRRRNWLRLGSKEAGPKIAAIFIASARAAADSAYPSANTCSTCCPAWPNSPCRLHRYRRMEKRTKSGGNPLRGRKL